MNKTQYYFCFARLDWFFYYHCLKETKKLNLKVYKYQCNQYKKENSSRFIIKDIMVSLIGLLIYSENVFKGL
jgi:hypothetical protein